MSSVGLTEVNLVELQCVLREGLAGTSLKGPVTALSNFSLINKDEGIDNSSGPSSLCL